MYRRTLQLSLLFALAVVLLTPPAVISKTANDAGAGNADETVRTASSLEYEFPAAPQERSRGECERISRFCDWLASHGALVDEDEETNTASPDNNEREIAAIEASREDDDEQESTDERDARDEEEVEETVAGTDEDEITSPNGTQNRSVVGWQSATVGSFQQQQSADPIKLEVPSLSIAADVSGVGISANREMVVPDDYNTVGWYRYGPRPGEEGSSVIAGHLDDAFGRSVFFDLQYIDIGEYVHITMDDGSVQSFKVTATVSYDSQNLPREIFTREGRPQLALLTCGGKWDSSAGRYTETVVVFAMPVD